MIRLFGLDIDQEWLATAALLLFFALLLATARKTLVRFSRKALLERLEGERRARYVEYLDRADLYRTALRFFDQIVRTAFVLSLVLAIVRPRLGALDLADRMLILGVLIVAVVGNVIVFLELVPAVLSQVSPERLLIHLLPILNRLYAVAALPIRFFSWLVAVVARALGSPPAREAAELVEEEILSAAEEGGREGVLHKSEVSMIEAIVEFRDREVSDILTPRTEMFAMDAGTSFEDAVRLAIECGHSRIPVYRETRDQIVGLLYAKDLLKFLRQEAGNGSRRIEDILRKPHFVPRTKKISELFQEFKTQRFHIAIVLDEFGGTSGLVTIEDIVEEILGEIEEEFAQQSEAVRPRFQRLGEDAIELDARLTVYDFNREIRGEFRYDPLPELPEEDDFDTVGGFLSSSMGKIPDVGDSFPYGQLHFEVLEADERTVRRILVRLLGAGTAVEEVEKR